LLLVFEAVLAGLAGTRGDFLGVSFFFTPIFILGKFWGRTTSTGGVCTVAADAWRETSSLESVLDLLLSNTSYWNKLHYNGKLQNYRKNIPAR
jgi:hypothetical protein